MRNTPAHLVCLGVLGGALLGGVAPSASAEVIYHENFTNTNASVVAPTSTLVGWQTNDTASGAPENNTQMTVSAGSTGLGAPPASVNSDPQQPDSDKGYIYFGFNRAPYLMWTDEYTISRSAYDFDTLAFSVDTNNDQPNEPMRIAVRIDGQWYASEAPDALGNDGWASSVTTGRVSVSTDPGGTTWVPFTFIAGSELSFDSGATPGALPTAGDISAFGIFSTTKGDGAGPGSDAIRIDNFHIEASPVPEPGALGLLSAGALLLARRRG